MVMLRLTLLTVLLVFSAGALNAETEKVQVENKIKNYFKDVMDKVHNEQDITKKREILNTSLQKMDKALSAAGTFLSAEEFASLDKMKNNIKEKLDELNGSNDYERVPDSQLNDFSKYVLQDFETADTYLYVSVTALLIIALLLILLL